MSFKLTWKSYVICFLISLILLLILNPIFDGILSDLFYGGIIFYPTKNLILNFNICTMLLMVPITAVHEIIHGAAYKVFGGKVKFGFKGIYAYTMEISGKKNTETTISYCFVGTFNSYLNFIFIISRMARKNDIFP